MSTIGILSIGEMGLGIASLLRDHSFHVVTSLGQRSEATRKRAVSAGVEMLPDDAALVERCDVLLSIVPPKDAFATAERVRDAVKGVAGAGKPLYYLDLNAVSPRSARATAGALAECENVTFIDGGIIGGPPKSKESSNDATGTTTTWTKPSLVVSGPTQLHDLSPDGPFLTSVLNIRHISPTLGTASGLKMCFASMTKGLTAIAIQAFTTAHTLGVHDELVSHLAEYSSKTGELAKAGLTGMPPKAYRWVAEMEMIDETFKEEGGFEGGMFGEVARVYDLVAHGTELGKERTGERKRGRTTEDVAGLVGEAIGKKAKVE